MHHAMGNHIPEHRINSQMIDHLTQITCTAENIIPKSNKIYRHTELHAYYFQFIILLQGSSCQERLTAELL